MLWIIGIVAVVALLAAFNAESTASEALGKIAAMQQAAWLTAYDEKHKGCDHYDGICRAEGGNA